MASANSNASLISSETVQGTEVYGDGGDKIGEIDHLMIDKPTGKVAYAVMTFGGILGVGSSHYPIPWSSLKYSTQRRGYETAIGEAQLQNAPQFTDDAWMNREWETRTHQHYRAPPYWGQ